MSYTDFVFKFPITGLTVALQGFVALQAAGLLGTGDIPADMLGTPRDPSGASVAPGTAPAWRGDPGRRAVTYTDPTTKQPVTIPAAGDPTQYYVAIRATVTGAQVAAAGLNPATYGLTVPPPDEATAVLGVWA